MRIKVLSCFLALQFLFLALWQGAQAWGNKPIPQEGVVQTETAPSHEAAKPSLTSLNRIQFMAKGSDTIYGALGSEEKSRLMEVISKLPSAHVSTLKNLVLDYNPLAHRGLGGKSIIILRGVDMDSGESASVLIHEIGHITDLGYLEEKNKESESAFRDGKFPVYESDPSLGFYRISWNNEKSRNVTASNSDFVSGYAMTDPFEDFAESYVYYILHNKDFKAKCQTSDALHQKYEYMKNKVFGGREYETGEVDLKDLNRRPWDITVLSYDLNSFLNG